MPFVTFLSSVTRISLATKLACTALAWCPVAWAQQSDLSEPVYHVASETPPAQATVTPPAVAQPQMPFNLTQQPGEHPLAPVIRVAEQSLLILDQNVQDYSCTFKKHERIDGELGEPQQIFLKVMHQPFSVYMAFLQPFPGREVAFVNGLNNNELVVLDCGWKRKIGKLHLDPEGATAMQGQKYPITRVGIRNLTAQLIEVAKADMQFAECDVTTVPNQKVEGRLTTMVQIVHPVARQNFRAYAARIFFDNELRIPIHYDSYLWPEAPSQAPPLEGSYTYSNLKINNGFNAIDFDSENNPDIFK